MENEMITVPETNELSEKDYQKLIYEESLKQTALLEKQINSSKKQKFFAFSDSFQNRV